VHQRKMERGVVDYGKTVREERSVCVVCLYMHGKLREEDFGDSGWKRYYRVEDLFK